MGDDGDVAGRGPGAARGDGLREEDRPRLDATRERAVVAEVEGEGEVATTDAETLRVEREHTVEDCVGRGRRGLDRPAGRAAAGEQPQREEVLGGAQEVAVDESDERHRRARRELGGRAVDGDRGAERLEAVGEDGGAVVVQGGARLDLPPREKRVALGELRQPREGWTRGVSTFTTTVGVAALRRWAVDVRRTARDADPELTSQPRGAVRVDLARATFRAAARRRPGLGWCGQRRGRRGGGIGAAFGRTGRCSDGVLGSTGDREQG